MKATHDYIMEFFRHEQGVNFVANLHDLHMRGGTIEEFEDLCVVGDSFILVS